MTELSAHFHDKLADLTTTGLAREEAEREAIRSFGEARSVARLMYQAYGRGSWVEALISCQPHLIAAWLLASHLWRVPLALGLCSVAFGVITLLGWKAGSPTWTYSWAGYGLFPPLVLAYLLRGVPVVAVASLSAGAAPLPELARIAGVALLYATTLVLLVAAAIRICRRDWILVSLVLLPLTVLGIWAYAVEHTGQLFIGTTVVNDLRWDRSMAWMCVVLGVAAAVFIRTRARLLKGAVVVAMGMVAGTVVVLSLHGGIGLARTLAACFSLFLVMMSPLGLTALAVRQEPAEVAAKEIHAA